MSVMMTLSLVFSLLYVIADSGVGMALLQFVSSITVFVENFFRKRRIHGHNGAGDESTESTGETSEVEEAGGAEADNAGDRGDGVSSPESAPTAAVE